jgi:ferritin-like metal-binding protein YciE
MGDIIENVKSQLTDRIDSPRNLLEFKLGSALKMEDTVLGMLDDRKERSQSAELKRQLAHHADETRSQISNIEKAFAALGVEPDRKPCPTIEALDKESKANLKIADERMTDSVILAGAAETEHIEIAMYDALIAHSEALGERDVTARLRENLEQERHTLEEFEQVMQQTARQLAQTA